MGATVIYFLIVLYAFSLFLYGFWRPSIRCFGLPLLDSYVIGLLLFATGSVAVWFEAIEYATDVAHIGLFAGISGTLGATIWARAILKGTAELPLATRILDISIGSGERFAVVAGLVLCICVSGAFLLAVVSNDQLYALYYKALVLKEISFTPARLAVSSGEHGYLYPGYIKQFRDILFPILLASVIIFRFGKTVNYILLVTFVVVYAAAFISGQRLIFAQLFLCILTAAVMDFFLRKPDARFSPLILGVLSAATIGALLFLTVLLGRLDMPLSPDFAPARNLELTAPAPQPKKNVVKKRGDEKRVADSEAAAPSPKDRELAGDKTSDRYQFPRPVAAVGALIHRAIIAVPRENTISYEFWALDAPTYGQGWLAEMQGVKPGTQKQLSNILSEANRGRQAGNSPMALAVDVYHNWGLVGVVTFPALFALVFAVIDKVLTFGNSAIFIGNKIFLYFSIPLMYSPFLFLLYGGAVTISIIIYISVLKLRMMEFMNLKA